MEQKGKLKAVVLQVLQVRLQQLHFGSAALSFLMCLVVRYSPVSPASLRVVSAHGAPCVAAGNTPHTQTPCLHGKTNPVVGGVGSRVGAPLWEAEGTCCPVVAELPCRPALMVGLKRQLVA